MFSSINRYDKRNSELLLLLQTFLHNNILFTKVYFNWYICEIRNNMKYLKISNYSKFPVG